MKVPLKKNRPSPIKWETFTSFSGLSPLLWETFTIFGQDLHRNTLFPTLRAPNGPSDGPIEAFAASFAPNGPSDGPIEAFAASFAPKGPPDGPLRAFSCSAYSAGKLLQGTTVFCLPCGQAHAPSSRSALILRAKADGCANFHIIFRALSFAVGLRKKCGRWKKRWQTYRTKGHYMKKSAVDQHVFFPSTALVSGIYRTIPRHLPHLAE